MTGEPVGDQNGSRRSRRDREQQSKGWVSASVWRVTFAWSPLVALVGSAAGGWFLIRLTLVSAGNHEYSFGPDVVVAGVVLLAWAGVTLILLSPPSSVLARRSGQGRPTGVVWALGRRFRAWNMLAIPVGGFLLGVLTAPPIMMWADETSDLASRLGVTALCTFASAVTALLLARLGICGVELTSTTLIARGYLSTRRYPRESIRNARRVQIRGLAEWGMAAITNTHTAVFTVRIDLSNGRERTLYASNSSLPDVEASAKLIRAWLADGRSEAERATVAHAPH